VGVFGCDVWQRRTSSLLYPVVAPSDNITRGRSYVAFSWTPPQDRLPFFSSQHRYTFGAMVYATDGLHCTGTEKVCDVYLFFSENLF